MEGHKITWNTNVPYEDLVKQCPFLSQRTSVSLEKKLGDDIKIPEIHISKSKKKRLKKRLKAISISNKNISSENLETEQSKMSSENKCPSVDNERKNQEHDLLKRVSDVVDGEIIVSQPKVGEGIFAERENQKSSKLKKKDYNKGDSISTVKSTATKPSEKGNHLKLGDNSEIIVDNVQHKNSQLVAQNKTIERPREEILAESDAKKKVKHLSKQKKIDKSLETSTEHLQQTEKKNISGIDNVQGNMSPLVTREKLGEEKSREKVLAEREAKKMAKVLAKQKKVYKTQQETVSESEKNEIEIKASPLDNKPENKKSCFKTNIANNDIENKVDVEKSKSQLRAERRAIQEAQRAAKEAEKKQHVVLAENKEKQTIKVIEKSFLIKETSKEPKTSSKGKIISHQRIKLFSHLHLGQRPSQTQLIQIIHPSVVELGIKYSSRIINGSNARCVALLKCLKEVIFDYSTPAEKEFSRGLESKLGELTNYLNQYRPFSVSMTNALRHIKSHLTQLPNNVSDEEAKRKLFDVIDTFIKEQIDVAGEAICESVKNKITNGDSILIYSCSSLLYRILTESYRSGRDFNVIVVDGGPWFEGREMLRRLVEAGLKCSYVQISALSFIVRQATKVLIGAHALLANGCVMSRAGSALVALAAHAHSVPVLVCCETYKFCERVQTDAFVYNELGSPDDLAKEDKRLSDWQSLTFLTPLSILYDITPPDLVTAVVTEIAILPCTSVPVILRVKPSDVVS